MVIVSEKVVELSGSIAALNLEMVKLKLQDADEGPGWDLATCELASMEYRRFLALKLAFPEKEIVPNRVVDLFWHQHILDTVAYAKDCEAVFGQFMHHFPYFGMNGADDAQNLVDAFEETKRLYAMSFGEAYGEGRGKCRTQCKPMKCK
jgi:hypothetical protein